jgi:hypothetical protein
MLLLPRLYKEELIFRFRISVCFLIMFFLLSWYAQPVLALDTSRSFFLSNFYYNSLIGDGEFIDINNMSETDIQNFLIGKGSYLKDFSEATDITPNRSAAKIIYEAAHGKYQATGTLNGIVVNESTGTVSPKVILATLQKEQSLITTPERNDGRLQRAMGYACPDGNSCNPSFLGFTKQVENAAWQLRYNYERASGHGFTDYQVSETRSYSDPTGSYSVTHNNRATASLYRYTPHVFNGNYNFWKLMFEYFNSTPPSPTTAFVNDASEVDTRTYKNSFTLEGTKTADSRVFFVGREIAGTGSNRWKIQFEPNVGRVSYNLEYKDSNANAIFGIKKITIDRHKSGDVNGDAKVDLLDLSILANAWGRNVPDDDWTNLNPESDSEINLLDLSILSANWN